ncbi:MAG: hypothetical protein H0V97_11525 [Actinobacteria bacterium]|nr:hypothetical protein [Actinomycetota bacterium]
MTRSVVLDGEMVVLDDDGIPDFAALWFRSRGSSDRRVCFMAFDVLHALLHGEGLIEDRSRQEVEVESVAFIVLSALGLDSASYSFPYVARWAGGDPKVITETGARVVSCARSILEQLETPHLILLSA